MRSRHTNLTPSPLKLRMLQNRLLKLLSMTPFQSFCEAIWSLDNIQSNSPPTARFFRGLPREVLTRDVTSRGYVHQWRLETLFGMFFRVSGRPSGKFRTRSLNLQAWSCFAELVNLVYDIEGEEAKFYMGDRPLREFHRIAQRQFPWQRGFANRAELYRNWRIYRTPVTMDFFAQKYGLDLDQFTLAAFAFWAQTRNSFATLNRTSFRSIGLSDRERDVFLDITSASATKCEAFYRQHATTRAPIAYQPCALRLTPIILLQTDGAFCAPLPDLVLQRGASGLFYDFVAEPSLRSATGAAFESYTAEVASRGRHGCQIESEFKYGRGTHLVGSLDLQLRHGGEVKIAIECKARRMGVAARFALDPIEEAKEAYSEISKGVVQHWRYIMDCAIGVVPVAKRCGDLSRHLVVTLDTWTDGGTAVPEIEKLAHQRADVLHIPTKHRRPVAITTIHDFEHVMERGTLQQIEAAIDAITTNEIYRGWALATAFDDLHGGIDPVLFDIDSLIANTAPWWSRFNPDHPDSIR